VPDRVPKSFLAQVKLASRSGQVDPLEGKRARALEQSPNLRKRLLGALSAELQVLGVERQLSLTAHQPYQAGAGNLDQALAPRLFLPQDNPLVDQLARLGIAHRLQRDLAAELDLDVANVAGTIDTPGIQRDERRRQDREHKERRSRQPLAERPGQGKHPCLPGISSFTSRTEFVPFHRT